MAAGWGLNFPLPSPALPSLPSPPSSQDPVHQFHQLVLLSSGFLLELWPCVFSAGSAPCGARMAWFLSPGGGGSLFCCVTPSFG